MLIDGGPDSGSVEVSFTNPKQLISLSFTLKGGLGVDVTVYDDNNEVIFQKDVSTLSLPFARRLCLPVDFICVSVCLLVCFHNNPKRNR